MTNLEHAAGATPRSAVSAITAVIVNKDAGKHLLACVASLRAGGIERIVVVDNASDDDSLEALRAADPGIELVALGYNAGYGTAVNRGASDRPGDLLVCNPDVVVTPEAPRLLAGALAEHPETAVVGPAIVDANGSLYPSARAFPSVVDAVGHAVVSLVKVDNPFTRRYHLAGRDRRAACEVDWVSGACFLVRRVAFDSVGGFDEAYFMYVEDLDLCWRLQRAGWAVRYEPSAMVRHDQGLSASRYPYAMHVAHHRSAWRFARRSSRGLGQVALPAVGAGLAARLGYSLAREALRRAPKPRPGLG